MPSARGRLWAINALSRMHGLEWTGGDVLGVNERRPLIRICEMNYAKLARDVFLDGKEKCRNK